jgi:WD40 repeat protein
MRLNQCNELAAVSMFDGSLKIYSNYVGDTIFDIKDDDMTAPITSLAWKPIVDEEVSKQQLLGACLDGSVIRWNSSMGNSVEHISLNERNKFHAIDFSGDLRRFCIAGSEPYIEIYDEIRMTQVQQIGDRVLKPAHSNKIFTCKFNPQAPNMIYSGSWDR